MTKEKTTELVAKAVNGDARSFEDLYSAYAKTILFHCRNLIADKNQYEDVAQEVAIALFRSIGTLKEPKAFPSWLHRVIRNTCINHNKKFFNEAESKKIENGEEALISLRNENMYENPEQYIAYKETFFGMLESLPAIQRETLILRYYDDLSYKEIADILGSTVSTVSTNIIKAKRSLEKAIAQENEKKMKASRIKEMITVGVNSLIPATAVSKFVSTASANALTQAGTAGAGNLTAGAGKSGLGIVKNVLIGTACAAVVTSGIIGVSASRGDIPEGAAGPASAETATQSEQTLTYAGTPHITFRNAAGEETQRNIASVSVSVTGSAYDAASEKAVWEVTDESGAVVLSGSGNTVSSGFDALPNGAYKMKFALSDANGSIAEISRSFFVDQPG